MTRSRISLDRLLFGVLGSSRTTSSVLREWNERFRLLHLDASMDRYPCTLHTIPERLSEMVHFDRRGYIVELALQERIVPYMDVLDAMAQASGRVDTIVHYDGVITGYDVSGSLELRMALWHLDARRRILPT